VYLDEVSCEVTHRPKDRWIALAKLPIERAEIADEGE